MAWLNLDIRSLIVLLVFANLLAVLLMAYPLRSQAVQRPDRAFLVGKLAQAAGWQLLALRGQTPILLSAHLGNSLLFFGFASEATAFLGVVTPGRGWLRAFLGIAALGTAAFWISGNDPNRWVALASFVTVTIYGTAAAGMVRHRNGSRLRLLLGLFFGLSSLALLLRTGEALISGSDFTLLSRNLVQTLAFLAIFLLTTTGVSGFPLLVKEREEQLLKENEAKFSTLFQDSPSVMILTRMADGRILEVNDQFEAWTGYAPSEAVGKTTLELGTFGGSPEAREAFIGELRAQGRIREAEIVFRRKSGETRTGLISSGTVTVNGEALVLASINDISERKRLEQEREGMIVELRTALADVRTLKGMLPICASCKRIRDDKGYWNQIEEYLQTHSGAEFTHGLCPECAAAFRRDIAPRKEA